MNNDFDDYVFAQVEQLTIIRYFPAMQPAALAAVARLIVQWCNKDKRGHTPKQQCAALVSAAISQFREWEGPPGLRDLYLSLYPDPPIVSVRGNDPYARLPKENS